MFEKLCEYFDVGFKVVVMVEVMMEVDQFKFFVKFIGLIDMVVVDVGLLGFKIYVEGVEVVGIVVSILECECQVVKLGFKGLVIFILMSGDFSGEVEIDIGNEYFVNL